MAHKPRKRFGQNFLVDHQVINRIISTIAPKKDDNIIEIGPGKGALSFPLAEHLEHLYVIEIDRDLISILSTHNNTKITIFNSDALAFNFNYFSEKVRIVGNLPYSISSPLLFHLLNFYFCLPMLADYNGISPQMQGKFKTKYWFFRSIPRLRSG